MRRNGKEAMLAIIDKMEFEAIKDMVPPGMGFDDPQMLEMLRQPFNVAKAAVRARIEAGQITTLEQLQQALMDEVMRAMGMGG